MSLDEMIAAAQKRFDGAEEGSSEAIQAQAETEALKAVRDAGYTKTQEDLNTADRKTRKAFDQYRARVEGVVGNFDEFEKIVTDAAPAATPAGEGEGETTDPAARRLLGELETRDEAIKNEREARLQFERELREERVTNRLERQFKELGLQDPYADAAREFVSPRLSSIVDKAMEGNDVSEDLGALSGRVKELSPVWFEKPKLKDEIELPSFPGRSPDGNEQTQLTDEQRAAKADSVI